jgi:diguanylate cyclase (GGDEF)-like protein
MEKTTLARRLVGAEPKLRRMLAYWAATGVLYMTCMVLMMLGIRFGLVERGAGLVLSAYGVTGVLFFFVLVRVSVALRIAPKTLAMLQGVFAITCNMWVYAISGPLRAASLIMLMVVITFCTFALRPRQTLLLSAVGIAGMGATMWFKALEDPANYPPVIEGLTFGFMSAALMSITLLTGVMNRLRARLKSQKEELLSAVTTIRMLATIDELTSLANRRYMNEVLEAEERRQRGTGQPTCIALLDIDFFKAINDEHGHASGDEVLRSFAGAARAELRASDMLARWGGEEFLLLLPDTRVAEANLVLERMAARVTAMRVPGVALARPISFSAGVCARADGEHFADTIGRADRALYLAKSAGRDRIVAA